MRAHGDGRGERRYILIAQKYVYTCLLYSNIHFCKAVQMYSMYTHAFGLEDQCAERFMCMMKQLKKLK